MTDILRSSLERLQAILGTTFNGRGVEASNVVQDVVAFCLDTVTESEIAYCSSLLFNDGFGVLTFIERTVTTREFENARTDLLRFLASYAEKVGNEIIPYVKAIKDSCLTVFQKDQSSKAKSESCNVLSQLLRKDDKSIEDKLDVSTLVSKFFSCCIQRDHHRFFSFCIQSSRETATVRANLYHLLGVFAEKYPAYLTDKADRLLSIYLGMLKQQMTAKQKKPEMQVIAGCLRGLSGLLVNFTQSVEEGSKFAQEIYKYTKMAIDPQVDLSRYDVPKAGLGLLGKHAGQFKELITDDYKVIHEILLRWSDSNNKDMKVAGLSAMESCLQQIAACIAERGKVATAQKESMRALQEFLTRFHRTLNSDQSSARELSLAIKGYGYFAGACRELLKESDVKLMFEEILQRCQHIYSNIDNLTDENLHFLPGFLEALASMIQQLNQVSDVYLLPMERMVIILFEHYPKLGKGGMFMYKKSLTHFIQSLSGNPAVMRVCLSHIVYQGLIRTCSHPVVTEEGLSEESESDQVLKEPKISYRSYLDLWAALLYERHYRPSGLQSDSGIAPEVLKEHVYDEVIQSVLYIIKKLNLKTEKDKSQDESESKGSDAVDGITSDPLNGLIADVPKDFQIFINLVEFCSVHSPGRF